uniref:Bm13363 n=1 Tax=Brugia malayi TaxID=6279 RepID=A0A1I9G015_BRUMA|nr:Bm13363 [Brugia malayi]
MDRLLFLASSFICTKEAITKFDSVDDKKRSTRLALFHLIHNKEGGI